MSHWARDLCARSRVDKDLAEIGDIFITGIVNESGSMEQLLLQTPGCPL